MNSIDPPGALPPGDCLTLINILASELGVVGRPGWAEWQVALPAGPGRTMIPVTGEDPSKSKQFVSNIDGIYDVTAQGGTPTKVVDFGTKTGRAGYGTWVNFTTVGGHFVAFCDEVNGYYTYAVATSTWLKVTLGTGASQVSGVDPAGFVACAAWQNRIWFVQANSSIAAYLALGAIYGPATAFNFGNKFLHGGDLVQLVNWTNDSGVGPNDNLVAISRGGDIAIYTGTDPAIAGQFTQIGLWFIGGTPAGRRVALNSGGDVLVTCPFGVLSLTRLVQGASIEDASIYETRKVSNLIASEFQNYGNLDGWELILHPNLNAVMLTIPAVVGQPRRAYAQQLNRKSWCIIRDLPINAMGVWKGNLYFATTDNRIAVTSGYQDNVPLPVGGVGTPTDITGQVFSAFDGLGSDPQFKRVQYVMPTFLADNILPSYLAEVRFDYDLTDVFGVPPAPTGNVGIWGTGLWGTAIWGGQQLAGQTWTGGGGIGRMVAINMVIRARAKYRLVDLNIQWEEAGYI